ncbi:hypothetical protein [uncultured Tenacibaculum sp.]|uniref:hypothetical protein n=1 Tax=uncultured Tenacibaculum sp. TaxID=174713 RepID=UPI0026047DB7|nr:hypothetical protein [uncultured Tenacibaculum sp.]
MKKSKEELKSYFEKGDKPTQAQYSDLIDSYIDAKQPAGEANREFRIDENGEVTVVSEKVIPEYTLSDITNNKLSLLKDGVAVKEIDLTDSFSTVVSERPTNLSFSNSLSGGLIESSTGQNALIPIANKDNMGLMKANFYEEVDFTPRLFAKESIENEYTSSLSIGKAVRVGNLVHYDLTIKNIVDPVDITGEGFYITGLPFSNIKIGSTYSNNSNILSFRATTIDSGLEANDLRVFMLLDRLLIVRADNLERVSGVSFNGGVSSNDIIISGTYITNSNI